MASLAFVTIVLSLFQICTDSRMASPRIRTPGVDRIFVDGYEKMCCQANFHVARGTSQDPPLQVADDAEIVLGYAVAMVVW